MDKNRKEVVKIVRNYTEASIRQRRFEKQFEPEPEPDFDKYREKQEMKKRRNQHKKNKYN